MWWILGALLGITLDKSTKEERARKRAEEWTGKSLLYGLIAMAFLACVVIGSYYWIVAQLR